MEIKRLIRINGDKIYLTPDTYLNISKTSLLGTNLKFSSTQDIYYEVNVLGHNKETSELTLEVINYQATNIEEFNKQTPKGTVSFIHFKPLDFKQVQKHLVSYTLQILIAKKIVTDDGSFLPGFNSRKTDESLDDKRKKQYAALSRFISFEPKGPIQYSKKEPVIETIIEESKIPFKMAEFKNGHVAFFYKSKQLNRQFDLRIDNSFLIKEFNAIKSYFPKAFGGRKQFSITVIFTLTDKSVTEIETSSKEIEAINANIIENIKHERIERFTSHPPVLRDDKILYTTDEIFNVFNDNPEEGNFFKQTEEEILNRLIVINKVRNATHLQYLSGAKQSARQKLRFTLKPDFGFLFFIEGETKYHFCWELLNTHATYLWTFDKKEDEIDGQYRRIEETINLIREIRREAYKSAYRNRVVDRDLTFTSIDHININSGEKESFVEWKNKLNALLV